MTRWVVAVVLVGASLSMSSLSQQTHVSRPSRPVTRQEWVGLASWCGADEWLNRYTAMGRRFNPETLEAAMWDIPLGSLVRVTNRDNGRSIVVRVTDRGPAQRLRKRRVIDLTRGAFAHLAPLRQGLIPVIVQQVRSGVR